MRSVVAPRCAAGPYSSIKTLAAIVFQLKGPGPV
jgi:hypothetical protein